MTKSPPTPLMALLPSVCEGLVFPAAIALLGRLVEGAVWVGGRCSKFMGEMGLLARVMRRFSDGNIICAKD